MSQSENIAENQDSIKSSSTPKRSRTTLWILMLSFGVPVILAYVIFFFVEVTSFTNRGEILNPILHIKDFQLTEGNGEIIPLDKLTYKWRLISFLDSTCNEACEKSIYSTRQIHTSLAKNQHRVYRMFVHFSPAGTALQSLIDKTHPNVIHVYGDEKTISDVIGNDLPLLENTVYIMDPMGNVMMRFTQEQPEKDFLYDLRKLLKASQIG